MNKIPLTFQIFLFLFQFSIILFSPIGKNTFFDLGMIFFIQFLIFQRKNKVRSISDNLFFVNSNLLLILVFGYNAEVLPVTGFPKFKLFIKFCYILYSLYLNFLSNSFKDRVEYFFLTVIISSNLFLSYFYLGVTIKHLPLFAYILVALIYLRNLNLSIKIDRISIFSIIIFILLFISYLFSYDSFSSFFALINFFTAILLFLLSRSLNERKYSYRFKRHLVVNLFITIALMFFLKVFMIFSISSLGSLKEYIAGYNINILGGFITVFLIPSFYYLLKFHKKQYLLQIGLLIFSIFILVYIFSRATFFGVFTTSILSFAYFLHINIKKKVQLPSFTNYFFVIIVLITLIFLYTKREMFLNSSSFLIRISIWKLFLKEIYTYSLYFGFGLDSPVLHASLPPVLPFELSNNFNEFLNQFGLFLHAHNMIVQMLYNFGIIGFLISVFFVIIIIRYYLKNKPRLSLDKVFTFSLMGMAIHELFDFTFFDTSILIPSVILIGLLVQSKSEKVISDSLINKFVVISLVLIFFFSIDIVSFLNQTRIIRNNYITDSIGNFIIKKDEVIEKENFERFVFYDSLRIYKKWNYKSNQLSGEFFYSLYKREKKPEFLNKANDYYEDCIQNNKYLTVCYYRLSQINKDLGNNTKSKEMEEKSKLYDKYNIFVKFYKQWD